MGDLGGLPRNVWADLTSAALHLVLSKYSNVIGSLIFDV